ncbi:AmmeMemoRadiSam system radical SAM enzyme [Patescibacteria group bacterium]|nr:AmmeMemoRadiSam system radical SAM enzyme [Patescibacteria group bacterium]
MFHKALLYDELGDNQVQCNLCAHRCRIREDSRGICRVRENRAGNLYTLVYGNLISQNVDPIEKKPLYHFLPGSMAFSIATPGCNFRCEWCQNWQISQMPREMGLPHGQRVAPEEVVEQAVKTGSKSIAYTYTEPTIFFEYSYDVSRLAKEKGLKNVYVTNGFMTSEMLDLYQPYLDAANVDIKAFKDDTYRTLMGGRLDPVLENCRKMKAMGIWLEITTLIVPGVNDDPEELKALAQFINEDLGPETPWHLSRFYPQYKMTNRNPTEEAILHETKAMGEDIGLDYIYIGNVMGRNSTFCKECDHELISRSGYSTRIIGLDENGNCENCGTPLDGVSMA